MKKPKAGRVAVLEHAFELNLPKLMRAAKAAGTDKLVLDDGNVRTVVALSQARLAVKLGERVWVVDIVAVPCLKDRLRPVLKCPRAHEGNYQSLYYRAGELACRHCHGLRYLTRLAPNATARARLARHKLLKAMGGDLSHTMPDRQPRAWRRSYRRSVARLGALTAMHYGEVREWLERTH